MSTDQQKEKPNNKKDDDVISLGDSDSDETDSDYVIEEISDTEDVSNVVEAASSVGKEPHQVQSKTGAVENETSDQQDTCDEEDESDEDEEESNDGSIDLEGSDEEEDENGSSSDESVWTSSEEVIETTIEAKEARLLKMYQEGLNFMVSGDKVKSKKIFENLLKKPLLSIFHKNDITFADNDKDLRTSKMARLFVGLHKNLGLIDDEKFLEHNLQILAMAPNADETIWYKVAQRCVHEGDLSFAKFALKKCSSKEAREALAVVLYLDCDFHACLELIRHELEEQDLSDKLIYLKNKIRAINQHYKQISDELFDENDTYEVLIEIDQAKIKTFDEQFQTLRSEVQAKIHLKTREYHQKEIESYDAIPVDIGTEQDFTTVATIFCDLFDRIESYSSLVRQKITFNEWENRKEFNEVKETMQEILDIVETVDGLVEKTCKKKGKKSIIDGPLWRPSAINTDDEEEEGDRNVRKMTSSCNSSLGLDLPSNSMAEKFSLGCAILVPLKMNEERRERSLSPILDENDIFDEELLLDEIRSKLILGSSDIFTILETIVLLVCDHCPSFGAMPKHLWQIVTQCYRRLTRMSSSLWEQKYYKVHVLLCEMGVEEAYNYCIKKYILGQIPTEKKDEEMSEESRQEERSLAARFLWKHIKTITDDDLIIAFGQELIESLEEGESFGTARGVFCKDDVINLIEDKEKAKRINSVTNLWEKKNYEDVIEILSASIDWSPLNIQETCQLLEYWLKSLKKLARTEELVSLSVRAFHFYLLSPTDSRLEDEKMVEEAFKLVRILAKINWTEQDKTTAGAVGYFICLLLDKPKMDKEFSIWKCLYRIVEAREEPFSDYLELLNGSEEEDSMPFQRLDVLAKAHSRMGAARCCGNNNYEFILFYAGKIRKVLKNTELVKLLQEKNHSWLWANLQAECTQMLHCVFGKYSKKKKSVEDHHAKNNLKLDVNLAKKILPISFNYPFPMHDDKEKLNNELPELILAKFPFLLEVSEERQKVRDQLQTLILASAKWENQVETFEENLENLETVEEPSVQSVIWYVMALHNHRQEKYEEAKKFAELYITSDHGAEDTRLRASAWVILAHTHVHTLFDSKDEKMCEEWRWRVVPFKMGLAGQPKEPVVHFEFAFHLYQLATCLLRIFKTRPLDDPQRGPVGEKTVKKIRAEALTHFQECMQLHPDGMANDGDLNWLSYFFVAKLTAKEENYDVVKVLDNLYEAACACEIHNYFYPLKVSHKKQENLEPVEVHYQVHASAWKYLQKTDNPPMETLIWILAYLRTFKMCHKVVKCSQSMFNHNPEVIAKTIEMTIECEKNGDEDEVMGVMTDLTTKTDLLQEIFDLCYAGFELVIERFPHIKAHYRLAQMDLVRKRPEAASAHIMKNVFRKKKSDNLFDHVVEIISHDITRAGSFSYHVERCLTMAIVFMAKNNDIHNLVTALTTMLGVVAFDDAQFVERRSHPRLTLQLLRLFRKMTTELAQKKSPLTSVKVELGRLWTALKKQQADVPLVKAIRKWVEEDLKKMFGANFGMILAESEKEEKKKGQKRKKDVPQAAVAPKKNPVGLSSSSPSTSSTPRPAQNQQMSIVPPALYATWQSCSPQKKLEIQAALIQMIRNKNLNPSNTADVVKMLSATFK